MQLLEMVRGMMRMKTMNPDANHETDNGELDTDEAVVVVVVGEDDAGGSDEEPDWDMTNGGTEKYLADGDDGNSYCCYSRQGPASEMVIGAKKSCIPASVPLFHDSRPN